MSEPRPSLPALNKSGFGCCCAHRLQSDVRAPLIAAVGRPGVGRLTKSPGWNRLRPVVECGVTLGSQGSRQLIETGDMDSGKIAAQSPTARYVRKNLASRPDLCLKRNHAGLASADIVPTCQVLKRVLLDIVTAPVAGCQVRFRPPTPAKWRLSPSQFPRSLPGEIGRVAAFGAIQWRRLAGDFNHTRRAETMATNESEMDLLRTVHEDVVRFF